jgi:hypothetical protein
MYMAVTSYSVFNTYPLNLKIIARTCVFVIIIVKCVQQSVGENFSLGNTTVFECVRNPDDGGIYIYIYIYV